MSDFATTSALPEEPDEARVEEWVIDAYRCLWRSNTRVKVGALY
jgi:hypothetical protein